jgi:hypothetical protein
MGRKGARAKLDAMLRHLACGQDPQDFPSTTHERLALIETAGSRGLIEWQKERGRYELTPIGWRQLTPRGGVGLGSLMVSSTIGATIGAAALAFLWLPAGSVSRSENPIVASASRLVDTGVHSPAPPAAVTRELRPGVAPGNPIEPPAVADRPVPEQPGAEAAPTGAKVAVKKSHRRTAYRHKREQTTWAFADLWRADRRPGPGRGLFR